MPLPWPPGVCVGFASCQSHCHTARCAAAVTFLTLFDQQKKLTHTIQPRTSNPATPTSCLSTPPHSLWPSARTFPRICVAGTALRAHQAAMHASGSMRRAFAGSRNAQVQHAPQLRQVWSTGRLWTDTTAAAVAFWCVRVQLLLHACCWTAFGYHKTLYVHPSSLQTYAQAAGCCSERSCLLLLPADTNPLLPLALPSPSQTRPASLTQPCLHGCYIRLVCINRWQHVSLCRGHAGRLWQCWRPSGSMRCVHPSRDCFMYFYGHARLLQQCGSAAMLQRSSTSNRSSSIASVQECVRDSSRRRKGPRLATSDAMCLLQHPPTRRCLSSVTQTPVGTSGAAADCVVSCCVVLCWLVSVPAHLPTHRTQNNRLCVSCCQTTAST